MRCHKSNGGWISEIPGFTIWAPTRSQAIEEAENYKLVGAYAYGSTKIIKK